MGDVKENIWAKCGIWLLCSMQYIFGWFTGGMWPVCILIWLVYGCHVKLLAMVRAGIDYVYMERIYQYSYFHVVALRRLFARISIIYRLQKVVCVEKKSS